MLPEAGTSYRPFYPALAPVARLTSNAIAQDPILNRGAWRRLENQIRKQTPVQVITGAIYASCGDEMIDAPCFIYKIALLPNGQILAAVAKNAPLRVPFTGEQSLFFLPNQQLRILRAELN